jgi:hypothetical protein
MGVVERMERSSAGGLAMNWESNQYAIVVEEPARNGYPPMVDYVDARNPRMIGHRSVINPPPPHFTYSLLELRPTIARLRKSYPGAHIEAHEIAFIDHAAMSERWSAAHSRWKEVRS